MNDMEDAQIKSQAENIAKLSPSFSPDSLKPESYDNKDLAKQDYKWRIKNRGIFAWTIMGILITQNILIYILIYWAFITDQLANLQIILGVLLSGTLVETYFTLNHVVKWLFSDIDYKAMKDL